MKILSITKTIYYFYILKDDGSTIKQRRCVLDPIDEPMTEDEEIIVALCEKINDIEKSI